MWKCPKNPTHRKFGATAHVTQDWIIDEDGYFLECVQECVEVTHAPDKEDIVICSVCGVEALWID